MSGAGSNIEGAACRPNYTASGRRRRTQFAAAAAAVTVLAIVWSIVAGLPWQVRLLVFAPAAMAIGGYLQVHRNTCVRRAREGVLELEDFSVTPADEEDARASRIVAATIIRDAVTGGALIAAASAAISLL